MEIKTQELIKLAIRGLDAEIDEMMLKARRADKRMTKYDGSAVYYHEFQKALKVREKYNKLADELIKKRNDLEFYYEAQALELV